MTADYRDTVRVPDSPVPMRANLPELEPKMVARWQELDLYARLRQARVGRPIFLLHDGPPYANGELHMGHALNKTLKDIVVRHRALRGFDTPFVPGWDCHGLPIEHNVMRELGDKAASLSQVEIRKLCRAFARRYVEIQREGFRRLGCIGHWENPYLTLDDEFEARILEAFGTLHEQGCIYRGLKPIHWCPSCRTALAASTAEAEYGDHDTDAITVAFPSVEDPNLAILIWTTTPWTLPANVAVAVRADLEYVTVQVGERRFLLAEALLPAVSTAAGWSHPEIIARVQGSAIEHRKFRHPFLDREVPAILGEFVTTDAGTGVVHIAPGHGVEDYHAGLKYKLPILAPVDDRGRLTEEAGVFRGIGVFEANPLIIGLLKDRGMLIHAETIRHSYPHCWRCKHPVIFRATRQWFMNVDHASGGKTLREIALAAVDAVQWIPNWGRDRFAGTVRERPDWCLSRQRSWGVPIPALVCDDCGHSVVDASLQAEVTALARAGRLDEWFAEDPAPRSCTCGKPLRRERDILDVWFDSGVSWYATDMFDGGSRRTGEPPIADLYLEGSDQHRGWFQSSLWPSLALRGVPPYRAVLTHGFMLDGDGKAMHKSAGNVIAPQDIMKKYGADIIRLWVASENYREDVRLSYVILDHVADTYRKIRNTWRFLAGVAKDLPLDVQVPVAGRPELDRWALSVLGRWLASVSRAYDEYAFHEVYRMTLELITGELSALYLDVIKDRLYCDAPDGAERRAAQATCREILSVTVRALAPILPFTTDEVWGHANIDKGAAADSIHLSDWPASLPVDEELLARFAPLLAARGEILKALEDQRAAGKIKKSQMARVTTRFQGDLETLRLLTQVAELVPGDVLMVEPTQLPKCPRCWRHLPLEGELCARCDTVVAALAR